MSPNALGLLSIPPEDFSLALLVGEVCGNTLAPRVGEVCISCGGRLSPRGVQDSLSEDIALVAKREGVVVFTALVGEGLGVDWRSGDGDAGDDGLLKGDALACGTEP